MRFDRVCLAQNMNFQCCGVQGGNGSAPTEDSQYQHRCGLLYYTWLFVLASELFLFFNLSLNAADWLLTLDETSIVASSSLSESLNELLLNCVKSTVPAVCLRCTGWLDASALASGLLIGVNPERVEMAGIVEGGGADGLAFSSSEIVMVFALASACRTAARVLRAGSGWVEEKAREALGAEPYVLFARDFAVGCEAERPFPFATRDLFAFVPDSSESLRARNRLSRSV